jgi:hypothetical protein
MLVCKYTMPTRMRTCRQGLLDLVRLFCEEYTVNLSEERTGTRATALHLAVLSEDPAMVDYVCQVRRTPHLSLYAHVHV